MIHRHKTGFLITARLHAALNLGQNIQVTINLSDFHIRTLSFLWCKLEGSFSSPFIYNYCLERVLNCSCIFPHDAFKLSNTVFSSLTQCSAQKFQMKRKLGKEINTPKGNPWFSTWNLLFSLLASLSEKNHDISLPCVASWIRANHSPRPALPQGNPASEQLITSKVPSCFAFLFVVQAALYISRGIQNAPFIR